MNTTDYHIRKFPEEQDLDAVKTLLEGTGFFYTAEIVIAIELIEETLRKGDSSDYRFIFAESGKDLLGYTCFGQVPLTKSSYDLYWIAVRNDLRGRGVGKELMTLTENDIRAAGGTQVYADTSSREQYAPTRQFYLSAGYIEAANLADFYAPGDGKIVYMKKLSQAGIILSSAP